MARLDHLCCHFIRLQGQHDEAGRLFRRCLNTTEKVLGPDHPNVATVLDKLVGLLTMQVRSSTRLAFQVCSVITCGSC